MLYITQCIICNLSNRVSQIQVEMLMYLHVHVRVSSINV